MVEFFISFQWKWIFTSSKVYQILTKTRIHVQTLEISYAVNQLK